MNGHSAGQEEALSSNPDSTTGVPVTQRPGQQQPRRHGVGSAARRQAERPGTGRGSAGTGRGGLRSEEVAPSSERALSLPLCVRVCVPKSFKPQ